MSVNLCQFVSQSVSQSVSLLVHQSVNFSVMVIASVCLSVCQSVKLFVIHSVGKSVCQPPNEPVGLIVIWYVSWSASLHQVYNNSYPAINWVSSCKNRATCIKLSMDSSLWNSDSSLFHHFMYGCAIKVTHLWIEEKKFRNLEWSPYPIFKSCCLFLCISKLANASKIKMFQKKCL